MTPWFSSSSSSAAADARTTTNHHHRHAGGTSSMGQNVRKKEPISLSKAVKLLHPPRPSMNACTARFSSLLLEHGEVILQDWAVVMNTTETAGVTVVRGSSSAATTNNNNNSSSSSQWNKSGRSHSSSSRSLKLNKNKVASVMPLPTPTQTMEGRLHLCTKCLFLEPTDPLQPMLRFPFAKMDQPPSENNSPVSSLNSNTTTSSINNLSDSYEIPLTASFESRRYYRIRNGISPVESVDQYTTIVNITFLHSSPTNFGQLCQKLYSICTYSIPNPTEALEEILKPMLYRPFDLSHLVHMQEVIQTPSLRAHRILPLQKQPGSVVLTKDRLYFQTATLAPEGGLVTTWSLSNVVAYARRYAGLKDCAVELYFQDGTSILLALEKVREREKVVSVLPEGIRCLTDREFCINAYNEWYAGRLKNREYLLVLNAAAGRSFHDLSRYPVFPWVIQDYQSDTLDLNNPDTFRDLTKPMGALNEKRLEYFKTRMEGMHADDMEKFLYGTHYSAPGYILYYLLRSMPQHMLCLQNGKFDAPDRMFHSIQACFECALTNHADVKELIPEFFFEYEFLINAQSLQLGATQLGDRVHDVTLPVWANRSPREFRKLHCRALESPHVTIHLPQWIDLIFGWRSRGDAAMEAQNLFHPTAYLTPSSQLETDQERYQAELQAAEFGTCPDQLFIQAHPLRKSSSSTSSIQHRHANNSNEIDTTSSSEYSFIHPTLGKVSHEFEGDALVSESTKQEAWELLEPPSSASLGEAPDPSSLESVDYSDCSPLGGDAAATASSNSLGFGTATTENTILPMTASSRRKDFASALTPIRKTSLDNDPSSPVLMTPGGKAKASWVTNQLSISSEDGTPVKDDPISYSLNTNPAHDLYPPSMGSTRARLASQEISRTIGLSGSGDLTSKGSKDLSFSSNAPMSHPSSRQVPPRPSPKMDGNVETGWDMKLLEKKKLHSDAISGCSLLAYDEGLFVTTVSLDGSMLINTVKLSSASPPSAAEDLRRNFTGTLSRFYAGGMPQAEKRQSKLSPYRSHTASDPLACLSLTDDGYGGHLVFAGGHDDIVMAYGINSACAVASVYSHRDAVTGLDVIARSPLIQSSALWSDSATHIMVSGSWDATVKVWSVAVTAGETVSINREPLAELFDADSTIVCLSATYVAGSGVAICTGCSDGSFVVWLCHDDGTKVVIHKEPPRRGAAPCAAVQWTRERGETFLFAGFANGRLSSFLLVAGNLIKVSAVSVGVAVTCLQYMEGTLLVGCSDGGLRLLPVRDGASFDGKPTLWNAVNGKSSPALTCSSIGFHDGRLLCSTGADDGSVAIFELKKAK